MTNALNSPSLRRTAAMRFVLDEMNVADLMQRLEEAHEIVGGLGGTAEKLAGAHQDYDMAKSYLEARRAELTLETAADVLAGDPKASQASIDRAVKAVLATDKGYLEKDERVLEEKNDLDDAQGNHDAAKSNQRTLLAKAQLTAATLQFLSASKTARATALAHLADL
jgi:hypothetical protein